MICRNNYIKYTTFPYPIFQPFHPPYAKLNLFHYIFFSHFKSFHSCFFYRATNYGLACKATWPLFFKVIQYSYVAPILHSVICSRWILFQLQTEGCCKKDKGSYKFMFSLETVTFFYVKSGLLCLLSYWESITRHL